MSSNLMDNALVFRRWLDLDAGFSAFNGLPIPVEARVFTNNSIVQCIHPYWPEKSIDLWVNRAGPPEDEIPLCGAATKNPINPDWRSILKSQNEVVGKSREVLEEYGTMAAESLGGEDWSIDFALGRDGKWYLIDCAAGSISFHPDGEPTSAPHQIKKCPHNNDVGVIT